MTATSADAAVLLAEVMRLQKLIDAVWAGVVRDGAGSTLALLDLAKHSCCTIIGGLERMARDRPAVRP